MASSWRPRALPVSPRPPRPRTAVSDRGAGQPGGTTTLPPPPRDKPGLKSRASHVAQGPDAHPSSLSTLGRYTARRVGCMRVEEGGDTMKIGLMVPLPGESPAPGTVIEQI